MFLKHFPRNLYSKCSGTLVVLLIFLSTRCISAAPLEPSQDLYGNFIKYLNSHNCAMPETVKLPFPATASENPWEYLSSPLKICQTAEALKDGEKATMLCYEVFEIIENITCHLNRSIELPEISAELSTNVCQDFGSLKVAIPVRKEYLGESLTKYVICTYVCADEYWPVCQVLLWSYDIQNQIADALKNKEKAGEKVKEVAAEKNASKNKENASEKAKEVAGEKNALKNNENTSEKLKKVAAEKNTLKIESAIEKTKKITAETNFVIPNEKEAAEMREIIQNNPDQNSIPESSKTSQKLTLVATEDTAQDNAENTLKEKLNSNDEKPIVKERDKLKTDDEKEKVNLDPDQIPEKVAEAKVDVHENIDAVHTQLPQISSIRVDVAKNTSLTKTLPLANDLLEEAHLKDKHINDKTLFNIKIFKPSKDAARKEVTVPDNKSSVNEINELPVDQMNKEKSGQQDEHAGENFEGPEITLKSDETDTSGVFVSEKGKNAEKVVVNLKISTVLDHETVPTSGKLSSVREKNKTPKSETSVHELKGTDTDNLDSVSAKNIDQKPETTSEVPLEKMEGGNNSPHNDEKTQYEYDGSLYLSTKNKELESVQNQPPTIPNIAVPDVSEISKNYDFLPRNNAGHRSDDIPGIPPFPEDEDGHFFFYFLSIVLIFMAGYLVFHNKQKIIALIVEGRHERRRRSHGVGYKKLETK